MNARVASSLLLLCALALVVAVPLSLAVPASQTEPSANPSITLTPSAFPPSKTIQMNVRGKHFRKRSKVTLLAGPPNSEGIPVDSARTGKRGRFTKSLTLRHAQVGSYVILACQRTCKIKASAPFTIG